MKAIKIPGYHHLQPVMANNIVRIEASSNYSKIYLDNGHWLTVAKVLHWFEDNLEDDFFCRIHKAHIVNRQFISTISADNNILTLLDGHQLKISRRRKNEVLKTLA